MFLAVALSTAFLTLTAAPPDKNWLNDYQKALTEAKAKNLPMFLVFTRTDGNPMCGRFESQILFSSKLKAFVRGKFVLVYLDCPRTPELANSLTKDNPAVAEQYQVKIYPTAIVTDSNGKVAGKLTYSKVDDFMARLRKIYGKVKTGGEHIVKK